jgi:ribonuclease-3
MDAAQRFIAERWEGLIRSFHVPPKDAKTALQEWAQARGLGLPEYRETERSGPAHTPEFTITVRVGNAHAEARARSKRAAEQEAAQKLLESLAADAFHNS